MRFMQVLRVLLNKIFSKIYLYTILREIWRPPEVVYRHLFFKGRFKVKIDRRRSFKMNHSGSYVENEIFWSGLYGRYEGTSLKLWTELSQQSKVILDIGANAGLYSLLASAVNPKASIFAFEPISRTYRRLLENIELNHFNIEAINKALSSFSGHVEAYDTLEENEYTFSLSHNAFGTQAIQIQIETETLFNFIQQKKLSCIDLMKIDVQCHEPEVLQGMGEYLSQFKPTMIIEVLEDYLGERIQEAISNIDYIYFEINEKKGVSRCSTIRKSTDFNYLICKSEVARFLNLPG